MNIKPIVFAVAVSISQIVTAQVNSPQSAGYAARAAEMLGDGNYQGCIDQCKVARNLGATNREQLDWLSALASFKGNFADSKAKLQEFCNRYKSSNKINSAKLMISILDFRQEQFAEALKVLESVDAKALTGDEAEDLAYYKAFSLIKLGKNDQAVAQLKLIEDTKKYKDAASFYNGYIQYCAGNFNEALSHFKNCNKTEAPGDMADFYVTQIYFKQEKFADAINLAMPLLSRKDIPESFKDETNRIVGECLYELGDISKAIEYLRPYVDKFGEDAPLSTRYIVGSECYQLGDYEKAISLLSDVTDLTDEMGQSAALTVGQSYHAIGNIKAAILAYDKATKLDFVPRLTEQAYYNYAVAQVDGGRVPFGSSIATLESFLKRYPNSKYAPKVNEYLLTGYMVSGDYEGALKALESLSDSSSETVLNARQQVNFVLGTRALQSGNYENAKMLLTEALKYESQNQDIALQSHLWLADALYYIGDDKAAISHYNTFLKKAPTGDANRGVAQYNLAYCHFNLKEYNVARTEFRAAESSRTLSKEAAVDCLNRIADTYYYSRDFKTASETYKKAYDKMPSYGDYSLYQFAIMKGNLGEDMQKLKSLEDLINKYPTSALRSNALVDMAETLSKLDRNIEAIEVYEKVANEYPTTSQGRNSLLQLATICVNNGNENVAIDYYKKLISNHPTSSESALAVRDLTRIYGDNGNIEDLNTFLTGIADAPQLDEVERNAIAAAALLRTAKGGADDDAKLAAALEILEKYPESEGAEEALRIAADIEFNQGKTDMALSHYTQLEEQASSARTRHAARIGVLRSARDMGYSDKVIAVSEKILASSASSNSDIQEVKFVRACAFAENGQDSNAIELWSELAKTPNEIYGTRATFELADYYFNKENIAKSMEFAEKLIDANPPHAYWLARTYILYSDILRAQGAEFEADEYLKVLRSNYPGTENDIFLMIDKRLPQ